MARLRRLRKVARAVFALAFALSAANQARAQGILFLGGSAAHRAMGGASTAAGVDAAGALYWNPAAISRLPYSEIVIGGEAVIPDIHIGSTIPAGALAPGLPAATQSGYTRSDGGVGIGSAVGLVYREDGSPLTFGLGLMTLGGGIVNFPGDPSNPILAPTSPLGTFILGPQASSALVLSLMPTVSYEITDRLAFGFSPMLDVSLASFDPAFFGPATSPTTPLPPPLGPAKAFPTGSHSRPFWGAGVRAGLSYLVTDNLAFGFSYSSPHWFETWRFFARDADGNPLNFSTQFSLPQIFSSGLSFKRDRLTLNTDVRWIDYRTTQLIGWSIAEGGANWDSIWAVASGGRYQLTDRLAVSLGYVFNENPVPNNLAFFNSMLPGVIQHTLSAGMDLQFNDHIGASFAYVHGFRNSITGSAVQALGTSTTLDAELDALVIGIHIRFGAPRTREVYVGDGTIVTPAMSPVGPQS